MIKCNGVEMEAARRVANYRDNFDFVDILSDGAADRMRLMVERSLSQLQIETDLLVWQIVNACEGRRWEASIDTVLDYLHYPAGYGTHGEPEPLTAIMIIRAVAFEAFPYEAVRKFADGYVHRDFIEFVGGGYPAGETQVRQFLADHTGGRQDNLVQFYRDRIADRVDYDRVVRFLRANKSWWAHHIDR